MPEEEVLDRRRKDIDRLTHVLSWQRYPVRYHSERFSDIRWHVPERKRLFEYKKEHTPSNSLMTSEYPC